MTKNKINVNIQKSKETNIIQILILLIYKYFHITFIEAYYTKLLNT